MKELSLAQMIQILLAGWPRIVVAMLIGLVICVAIALASSKIYESEVVLLPKESSASVGLASQLGQLGGLAGLMGLNVGGSQKRDESVAVLRSRAFVAEFIRQNELLPQLSEAKRRPFDFGASGALKMMDAVDYFNSKFRGIYDDKKLGIVKITIRWSDPAVAADLANKMARQLNWEVRQQAITEATVNIEYLRSELEKSQLVSLSESIGALLEGEIKRLMIARGSEEYAFRIIDPAQPATRPLWPRPVFLGALGMLLGAMLASLSLVLVPGRALENGSGPPPV